MMDFYQTCKESSIQSGDSGTTFWNTTPTFGTLPHRAAGNLGQLFGTPPQHHPIGATSRIPTGQVGEFWCNFMEHHPIEPQDHQTTNQTARNTIYGEGSGATFGTPPYRAAGQRPREWDTFLMTGGANQPWVAARNHHVCTTFRWEPTRSRQGIIICVRNNPPKTNTRPSPRPKQPAWDQYYGARPTPWHRTIEPDLMQSVHPYDI